jgi:hypothetical protein
MYLNSKVVLYMQLFLLYSIEALYNKYPEPAKDNWTILWNSCRESINNMGKASEVKK